jgi:hypothetical protein
MCEDDLKGLDAESDSEQVKLRVEDASAKEAFVGAESFSKGLGQSGPRARWVLVTV